MAEPPVTFTVLPRQLHTQARLTQEELAEATSLSPRSTVIWNAYAETTP